MLKSMTGYGRGEGETGLGRVLVESRSVNHRYSDINIRLPKRLAPFENRIKEMIRSHVSRGRIDISMKLDALEGEKVQLQVNSSLAEQYFQALPIEINSSFYAPPRPSDAASWARRVANNPRFRFTAKAWQRLTHERNEATEESLKADADSVRRSMTPLAEAGVLGALLIQFPWSFRHTPRTSSTWSVSSACWPVSVSCSKYAARLVDNNEDVFAFLKEHRVGFCNIDQPVIGNSLRPSSHVTSPVGYFRLHGRNYENRFKEDAGRDARYDYLYPKSEIREVARRLQSCRQITEMQGLIHIRSLPQADGIDPGTSLGQQLFSGMEGEKKQ